MIEEKDFIVDKREYTIRGNWKGPDWTRPAEQTGPERRQGRVREEKREGDKQTERRAEDQDNQEQIKR